jgi:hypothetical protein
VTRPITPITPHRLLVRTTWWTTHRLRGHDASGRRIQLGWPAPWSGEPGSARGAPPSRILAPSDSRIDPVSRSVKSIWREPGSQLVCPLRQMRVVRWPPFPVRRVTHLGADDQTTGTKTSVEAFERRVISHGQGTPGNLATGAGLPGARCRLMGCRAEWLGRRLALRARGRRGCVGLASHKAGCQHHDHSDAARKADQPTSS